MKLYHGTISENKKNIETKGLTPKTGAFVSDMYSKPKAMVFACDNENMSKAVSAIISQIKYKLNLKSLTQVTEKMIIENGVLFEITETASFNFRASNEAKELHPEGVERNDYYSYDKVNVSKSITGVEVLNICKENGYKEVEYVAPQKGVFGGL